jgi:hypothetical protein
VNKHDCDSRVTSCEKWRAEFSSRQQCARRPLGGSKALAHTQSLASSPLCPALFGALGAHGSALGRQLSGARRRADCRPLRGSCTCFANDKPVSPDVRRFLRPFKTRLRTCFCPPRIQRAAVNRKINKGSTEKMLRVRAQCQADIETAACLLRSFFLYRMEIFQRPTGGAR